MTNENKDNNINAETTITITFAHPDFGELQAIERDGEVWFIGRDVANILGFEDFVNAINQYVDEEDAGKFAINTSKGYLSHLIINEPGLYSLIFASELPKVAKRFKQWVNSQVLPSMREIRKIQADERIEKITIKALKSYMQDTAIPYITEKVESMKDEIISAIRPNDKDIIPGITTWERNVGNCIARKVADVYGIDIQEAFEKIYNMMWFCFGFCKEQASLDYLAKYNTKATSTNALIAENALYREQFAKSAILLFNVYHNGHMFNFVGERMRAPS